MDVRTDVGTAGLLTGCSPGTVWRVQAASGVSPEVFVWSWFCVLYAITAGLAKHYSKIRSQRFLFTFAGFSAAQPSLHFTEQI